MFNKRIQLLLTAASILFLSTILHAEERQVRVIKVQAAINPTIAEFVTSSIKKAAVSGDEAIVIELDTPGGLDTSMRDIIKELLSPSCNSLRTSRRWKGGICRGSDNHGGQYCSHDTRNQHRSRTPCEYGRWRGK